jgi:uncharacterized protein DUF1329
MKFWKPAGLVAVLITALLLAPCGEAEAQVKPGDLITPANATKVKAIVSPGTYYKLMHGMTMKIIPTGRIDWPPPYKDATEKYSGQVRLSSDRRGIVGYVAGLPFPMLDLNDPDVATKIMWNNAFRPIFTDDYDLRFFDCDSVYGEAGKKQTSQVEYFQVGHYAGYSLVGRTEVEPMPFDPDFKHTNRYWLFGLYPILAPAEIKGTGFVRWRYADPLRGDDVWSFLPAARRLRRLNETTLSDSTAPGTSAHAWDPDHYTGFNAKNEEYNYKLLADKTMLTVAEALHSPEIRCETDNGASACPEGWELRHNYVIEARPRSDRASGARDSKTIVYIDSELWFPLDANVYDWRGELHISNIHMVAYRDRPVPDARVAIYPFKRLFVVGAVSTDVQSGLATMCYLPGIETPERECWYINMGAVDKSFFSPDAMVAAAGR